jgi:2,6-dihydroxypyridine 3-monooxygenase
MAVRAFPPGTAPRVAVIGGSLGGLLAAIALRAVGCAVDVFERVPQRLEAQGAGLRIVPEMARLLEERAGIALAGASTRTRWFRHIGAGNRLISNQAIAGQFTSWGTFHRALSAAFDPARYHLDAACTGVAEQDDVIEVRFADGRAKTFDLVVFADGILSTGRGIIAPEATLDYAGYVTWRGFVPAVALSMESRAIFAESVTYATPPYSHMIVYPIPDPAARDAGEVVYNFVWYRNRAEGSDLDALMTDRAGVRRPISLPAGSLRPQFVTEIRAATAELPPAHAEVVAKTQEPFIQALYDVVVPRMVKGRACLIGDAAFVTRPHAGAATTKAAVDAWRLADLLVEAGGDVPAALAAWEPEQLEIGRAFVERNREMGRRSLVENRFDPAAPSTQPGLYGPGR